MKESTILYENGMFYVCRKGKGFEVYKTVGTHSERCAQIGYEGEKGLRRAIQEADTRASKAMPDSNRGDTSVPGKSK